VIILMFVMMVIRFHFWHCWWPWC